MKKLLFFFVSIFSIFGFCSAVNVNKTYYIPQLYYSVSSSNFSSGYPAWKAFDGITGVDLNAWITTNSVTNGWLQIKLPSPTKLRKYKIFAGLNGDFSFGPRDRTFQGSTDGSTWTTLDTQTSQTFSNRNGKSYTFSSVLEYQYYRFNVTANNGGVFLAVEEEELFPVLDDGTNGNNNMLGMMTSDTTVLADRIVVISGSYSVVLSGSDYIKYEPLYNGLTGVNIYWADNVGGIWQDFYQKQNVYLSGNYTKSYTGGTANYWVMSPYCAPVTPAVPFTGYALSFTGEIIAVSGSVATSFANFGLNLNKLFFGSLPGFFAFLGVVLVILFILRLIFPKRKTL